MLEFYNGREVERSNLPKTVYCRSIEYKGVKGTVPEY